MFSLKTLMLKNIDVFQTSSNTNFPPIILHCYHVLHSRISVLCSVYITIWSKGVNQETEMADLVLDKVSQSEYNAGAGQMVYSEKVETESGYSL